MSWITRNHKQDVVYWGSPTPNGYGGYEFADAVDIKGRWEDTNRIFIDKDGNEVVSKAVVYLGQDVAMGGFLYLGESSDISSANQDNPENVSGAYQIRGINKIPNIKGNLFEREVFLTGGLVQ